MRKNLGGIEVITVSFVIPNYNGEKYIESCLDSVYKQDFKSIDGLERVEVILADNASTDDSVTIAQQKYKGLKVILSRENKGVANAINRGIESANGEYIAVLHVDTVLEKDWLKHSLAAIKENSRAFAAAGLIIKNDGEGIIESRGYGFTSAGYAYKIDAGKPVTKTEKAKTVVAPHNAAALYCRRIFDITGKFDESFFAYLEDADIGIRAYLRGFDTVYTPDAVAYHSGFTLSDGKECDFTARFKARNNVYIRYKNLTPFQRFGGKFKLSGGLKKLRKYYGRMGFESNVEEGIHEAQCTKKKCSREYKKSVFKRKIAFKNKMFRSAFGKKRVL